MCKDLCRACGQPLPPKEREGIYLTPRKGMIYDTILKHPGITAEGIQAALPQFNMSIHNIRVHLCQTNEILAGTDVRIKGDGGCYRIVRHSTDKRRSLRY